LFFLPMLCYCFSPVFRVFARLEYRVANELWQEAQITLAEARAMSSTGDELQWSHEVDCFEYEGQILTVFGQRTAAIAAWQKALALAKEHDHAVSFRTVGCHLANAYEASARWADLNDLLLQLLPSWEQAGRKGRSELQTLAKQRERIPLQFRKDLDYADERRTAVL
jgi:hypothetical protein